jgi:hypothetical protein
LILPLVTGVLAGLVSFVGLWALTKFLSNMHETELSPHRPQWMMIMLMKLPMLAGLYLIGMSAGKGADQWFGYGIALVYSCAVLWVAFKK